MDFLFDYFILQKRAPKRKCDTVEDKILKKIRLDLQGQRVCVNILVLKYFRV